MTTPAQTGLAGVRSLLTSAYRTILRSEQGVNIFAGMATVDGSKCRDPLNTGNLDVLSAGTLMGKITSGGKYACSIMGLTAEALTGAATTLDIPNAAAVELARRVGATGTFKLWGPSSANGTDSRRVTVTYSAIGAADSGGAGEARLTITATGTNQVDQVNINPASTGGNLQLTVQKPDGTYVTTASAAWNATDATYLSAINSALDTATGVSGGIVASAIPATDTDLGIRLTYSGTGYAGKTWALAQVALLPTTSTNWNSTIVTAAVQGAFASGVAIQPTDGSEVLLGCVPDGHGWKVTDDTGANEDQDLKGLIIGGYVDESQFRNWPTDTGLQAAMRAELRLAGRWCFDGLNF